MTWRAPAEDYWLARQMLTTCPRASPSETASQRPGGWCTIRRLEIGPPDGERGMTSGAGKYLDEMRALNTFRSRLALLLFGIAFGTCVALIMRL